MGEEQLRIVVFIPFSIFTVFRQLENDLFTVI